MAGYVSGVHLHHHYGVTMTRSLIAFLGAALLVGCSNDADKDGFDADVDCDDDNSAVHEDAVEICDGIDNDCDNEVDEGLRGTYYRDLDGDGYGDPTAETLSCSLPADHAILAGDCADTDPARNPGAPETDCNDPVDYNCDGSVGYADVDGDGIAACGDCNDGDAAIYAGANEVCDDKDNDCDGDVDEDPLDGNTFYIDHDGDGFGDASDSYSVVACGDAPDGFVDDNTDCNDLAATAYPGAEEFCDGLDNDCNDLVDVDDPDVTDAGYYYPDSDGDGFGEEGALTRACENLDGFITVGGDCDDTRELVNPDQTEVCNNGLDDDCDTVVTCNLDLGDADATFTGADADDNAGTAIVGAGDVNQDGIDDLLIGAEAADADGDGDDEGALYVVFGPVSTSGSTTSVDDADLAIAGGDNNGRFGLTAAGLGDVNGDGVPDFASAASNHGEHATLTRAANGGVWVFFGGSSLGTSGVDSVEDASVWFYGDRNYDWLGGLIESAGDLDGDGLADIVMGATGDDDGGAQSGAFYLFYGATSLADSSVADADILLYGDSASNRAGNVAKGVGDLNNDGFGDILFGVPFLADNGSNAGAVFVGLGPMSAGTNAAVSSSDAVVYGGSDQDLAGAAVSPAGDMDDDGYDDVFVGASGDSTLGGSSSGSLFLIMGSATIDTDLDGLDLDAVYAAQVYGADSDDNIGGAIAGGEDFDGDGTPDLVVGGTAAGVQGEGRAYVLYGPFSGSLDVEDNAIAIFEGVDVDDGAGSEVSLLGDVGSTGVSAIGIGAANANQSATDAGSAYVVLSVGL